MFFCFRCTRNSCQNAGLARNTKLHRIKADWRAFFTQIKHCTGATGAMCALPKISTEHNSTQGAAREEPRSRVRTRLRLEPCTPPSLHSHWRHWDHVCITADLLEAHFDKRRCAGNVPLDATFAKRDARHTPQPTQALPHIVESCSRLINHHGNEAEGAEHGCRGRNSEGCFQDEGQEARGQTGFPSRNIR